MKNFDCPRFLEWLIIWNGGSRILNTDDESLSPDAKEYGFIFSFVLIELLFWRNSGWSPHSWYYIGKPDLKTQKTTAEKSYWHSFLWGPRTIPTSAVSVAACLAENWERHPDLIPPPKTEGTPAPDRHLQIKSPFGASTCLLPSLSQRSYITVKT